MTILQEAESLVYGDRNAQYGDPRDDYMKTSKIWSGLLIHKLKPGVEITPEEAIMMMALMKISREANKHKRDNLVDAVGYMLCLKWAIDGKPDRQPLEGGYQEMDTDVSKLLPLPTPPIIHEKTDEEIATNEIANLRRFVASYTFPGGFQQTVVTHMIDRLEESLKGHL